MAPAATEMPARPAPPRMPKLAYRNRLPDDQSSVSSNATSGSETHLADVISDLRLLTPTSTTTLSTLSPVRPSFDTRTLSSTSYSVASSDGSTASTSKAPKKKKNAMLGFLTLKEPSSSALEQYAESQRRQAADKGAKSSSVVGLGGVSTAKLPASVPKVNSKWDGVPQSVKARDSIISSKTSKRASTSSQPSTRLSRTGSLSRHSFTSDGPPNSLASSTNSIVLRNSGVSSNSSINDRHPARHGRSPSTSSLPEITYFFPDNLNVSDSSSGPSNASLADTASSLSQGTSPAPQHRQPIQVPRPEQMLTANVPESPSQTESSGSSGSVDTQAIFRRIAATQGFLAGEAQEVKFPDDASEELDDKHAFAVCEISDYPSTAIAISSEETEPLEYPTDFAVGPPSPGILRPATMNFSRPLSSQISPQLAPTVPDMSRLSIATVNNKYGLSELPTLYEASVDSSNDTIDDPPSLDGPTDAKDDDDSVSIAPSFSSSVAPSVMSASWTLSPRERLGLGGRISFRQGDVLPWEGREISPGKKKKSKGFFAKS